MVIDDFKILERILKPCRIYNLYHFAPVEGFSIDSRSIRKKQGFIAIKGKYHDGHKFIQEAINGGASFIIGEEYTPVKPRIPFFIVNNTYESLSALAAYIRKKKKPLVYGITGSVGKTTTKEMLSFLLEPYFKVLKSEKTENNILGVGKTFFSLKDEKTAVLELGTNRKGEIESLARISTPDIGIITFIKAVHLEGLGSLRGVLEEKISLLKANPLMKAVLNRDDSYLAGVKNKGKIYWFGRDRKNDLFARLTKREQGNSFFLIRDKYELILPCYLEGFIANFLAAILGAHLSGISLKDLTGRMNQFRNFPPMRMEMKKINEFFILNDAYNANPYSFTEALKSLKKCPLKKIAVIGDMLELGKKSVYYHQLLASQIITSNFDCCLTLGDYSYHLKNRLQELGHEQAFHFFSHKDIARFIKKRIGRYSKKRYLIFLKGSRKMELEKVINYL